MHFGVRNAYYLRISASTVLPLYLYLDERHIKWMSERTLQHVLEDLRPRILTKLKDEVDAHLGPGGSANAKRGAVDVHRGDTYQFGYFLRKTDPHSVLVKTRHFVAAPRPSAVLPPKSDSSSPQPLTQKRKKRVSKKSTPITKPAKKRKTKGKQKAQESDEDEGAISISSDDDNVDIEVATPSIPAPPRRSARTSAMVTRGYREQNDDEGVQTLEVIEVDVEMADPSDSHDVPKQITGPTDSSPALDVSGLITLEESERVPPSEIKREDAEPQLNDLFANNVPQVPEGDDRMDMAASSAPVAELDLEVEETDAKPKPSLQLTYQGFNIHGRCLCVIVEPWPPIRAATRAPSLAPTGIIAPRAQSIAPPDFVPSGGAGQRARTPLFLPEYDRERSVTPAPLFMSHAQRPLPPVPLFHDDAPDDSDSDDDSLMQFSQMLRSVGEYQAGAVGDDDEIDGAVFFGDADETREL